MKDFEEIEKRLNITNSQDHPTNGAYKVYHFSMQEQATYFTELLEEKNIPFESDKTDSNGKIKYLFGIRKTDVDKVTKLNYLALGKYRKPFIANSGFKWFILLLGLGALALAVVGYFIKK